MDARPRVAAVALSLVLLTLFLAPPAGAGRGESLQVPLDLPAGNALGAYTGTVRIAVGEVKDETFSENPSHVGMGPQAIYEIVTEGTRAEYVRKGISEALGQVGLLAASPADAVYTLDVTILRDHLQTHQTFGRFRLRTELFLDFAFKRNGVREGWVLACGNSQTYAQLASKAKFVETYQLAFNDAVHKLFNSGTLARIAGEGWKPAPAPASAGEHNTTRIAKDEFYGPTDFIQAEAAKAAKAIQGAGPADRVWLPDFLLEEVGGKEKDAISDPAFARAFVPALVREHLNAFYPGAFAAIERGSEPSAKQGIAVNGTLDDFRIGSFAMRVWVGFGAGKDKLAGEVAFKDAATGSTLHTTDVSSSNWGAGWQTKQGTLRDMADQLARDLAYFLVRTAEPGYKPPEGLEILFDDTAYPMKQRKS